MGVYIPEGYGLAAARMSLAGRAKRYVFTIGINIIDGPDEAAEEVYESLVGVGNDWGPCAAGNMCVGYTLEGVTVTKGPSEAAEIGQFTFSTAGTNAAAALPPNCAVLVRKNTALGGRKGRGRMFLPPFGMAEGVTDTAGNIAVGPVNSMQTGWNNFMARIDPEHARGPWLLHSNDDGENGGGDFEPLTPPTRITSLTVQTLIATQRRRLR